MVYQTAGDVPGHPEKKHQDWFDEHDKHLKKPLKARNTSGQENLQCNTKSKKKKIQRQKCTRKTKSNWWKKKLKKKKKPEELQTAVDMKDMKTFFKALMETYMYGPKPRGLIQLRALNDESVLQWKDKILDRFADHFNQLLNSPGDLTEETKEAL